MMRKLSLVLFFALISWGSHVQAQSSDLTRIIHTLADEPPAMYESVMHDFVKAAKANDIDKMLALTSPVTRKKMGDAALRDMYAKEYVLLFTKLLPNVSKGGSNTFISAAHGGPGWVFRKQLTDGKGKSAILDFAVLKENGSYYLGGVRLVSAKDANRDKGKKVAAH